MTDGKNYQKTKLACYLGFVTQAIVANFIPLLFLTFYKTYGISFADLALIPLAFFLTQLIVDFFVQNLWTGSVTEKVSSSHRSWPVPG